MKLSESRGEAEKHRRQYFDHELKNMISSLTNMGSEKAGPSRYEEKANEEDGIRVITLSGSNLGATMKTELGDNHGDNNRELDFLSTFVNSNFQAVNNSIMMEANYETNDPGVHLDISGDVEKKPSMKAPKKKGKTSSKSDR
ncbi:hypothetical protein EUTSA_v10029291mg [Eutrema salsugineum]|uniref:Uncharacterized protein n=1 Tax=Eutrema salsugineum TaxID=72664 RepID=V4L7Z3_EUTSA|nr:uncharacterized protein LOC18014245 [Eutrema salsugineum]ESQ38462.1 hypothetical protein EUTSA_v10029291mg [Eutrema salsugineum]